MLDLDLSDIINLDYKNRISNLKIYSNSNPPSTKFFPIYKLEAKNYIFKPMSYTKPLSTPLFCYSEVIWSHYIKKYFYKSGVECKLAMCHGITDEQPKYSEKGIIIESYLAAEEKDISLFEYFEKHPDPSFSISDYTNYCLCFYNYIPIFESKLMKSRKDLSEQLASLYLISLLTRNENFHYENIRLICRNDEVIRLAPPVDNEFSMNFIYADDHNKHTFYSNLFSYSLIKPKVLNQNLEYIVEHYPDVCNEFLISLELFDNDIAKKPIMIPSNDFNKMICSEEYQIHCARIKDKDELKAKELTRSIKSKQIDYTKFNQQLNQEITENNYLIKTITNRFIQKEN